MRCEDENFRLCGGLVVVRTYWKMPHSACLLPRDGAIETVRNFVSSGMATLRRKEAQILIRIFARKKDSAKFSKKQQKLTLVSCLPTRWTWVGLEPLRGRATIIPPFQESGWTFVQSPTVQKRFAVNFLHDPKNIVTEIVFAKMWYVFLNSSKCFADFPRTCEVWGGTTPYIPISYDCVTVQLARPVALMARFGERMKTAWQVVLRKIALAERDKPLALLATKNMGVKV